jgi:hypothetical protein
MSDKRDTPHRVPQDGPQPTATQCRCAKHVDAFPHRPYKGVLGPAANSGFQIGRELTEYKRPKGASARWPANSVPPGRVWQSMQLQIWTSSSPRADLLRGKIAGVALPLRAVFPHARHKWWQASVRPLKPATYASALSPNRVNPQFSPSSKRRVGMVSKLQATLADKSPRLNRRRLPTADGPRRRSSALPGASRRSPAPAVHSFGTVRGPEAVDLWNKTSTFAVLCT